MHPPMPIRGTAGALGAAVVACGAVASRFNRSVPAGCSAYHMVAVSRPSTSSATPTTRNGHRLRRAGTGVAWSSVLARSLGVSWSSVVVGGVGSSTRASGGRGWVGIDQASGRLTGLGGTRTASSAGTGWGWIDSAVSSSRSCSAVGRASASLTMPARRRSSSSTGTPGRSGIGSSNSSSSSSRLGSRWSNQRGGLPRSSA